MQNNLQILKNLEAVFIDIFIFPIMIFLRVILISYN